MQLFTINEIGQKMTKTRGLLTVGIIFLMGLLAGCNPFMPFRPDSQALVKKGWAKYPLGQADPEPIYCYNTLGYTDCYSAPLDDQSRLSGYYGPKP